MFDNKFLRRYEIQNVKHIGRVGDKKNKRWFPLIHEWFIKFLMCVKTLYTAQNSSRLHNKTECILKSFVFLVILFKIHFCVYVMFFIFYYIRSLFIFTKKSCDIIATLFN